jgi:hypothetical protein
MIAFLDAFGTIYLYFVTLLLRLFSKPYSQIIAPALPIVNTLFENIFQAYWAFAKIYIDKYL